MKYVVLTLCACLALAGCGSDPAAQPDPSPPPSTSSAVATPTTPAPPTMPALARQHTKAGAIAFAKYFWSMVDHAQRTGVTDRLRDLQVPDCAACTAGWRAIERITRKGGRITGGAHRVVHAEAPFFNPRSVGLSLTIQTMPEWVRGAGKLDGHYLGASQFVTMKVVADAGGWQVSGMEFVN